MSDITHETLFAAGLHAYQDGNLEDAIPTFQRAVTMGKNPVHCSYLAFCLARQRGDFKTATALSMEALKKDRVNPLHYLFLGRIYLLEDRKKEAIRFFQKGLAFDRNHPELIRELRQLGIRKTPFLTFLKRTNPINKYLGLLLKKWR